MGQTVVEKIAESHLAEGPRRPLRAGDFVSLRPRHIMTHDNTAAVMKKFRAIGAPRVADPSQPVFTLDHDIQNTSEENLAKYRSIEELAREQGISFHPAGSGIGHQIMVEEGYVLPGSLVVASDSHSNMYGALGALGTPVVRTDAAAIWARGEFWWQIPRTVRVVLEGCLRRGVTGKDAIIALCGLYNRGEVLNAAVEFAGDGIAGLSLDERLTIANMTTEWGALSGWFPVDGVTLEYLGGRRETLAARGNDRIRGEDLEEWATRPPAPDAGAAYAAEIRIRLDDITPHVSGPDTVQVMTPVSEIARMRVVIHRAYLVSCVNSRVSDIEAAARVLAGRKVAPGVELYVAAASREVEEEAQRGGAWRTLKQAGAIFLPPGCGPCIGLGTGLLEPGEVGISATNRNFKGRMGSREAQCYLGSPAVVAASAAAGYICGPVEHPPVAVRRDIDEFEAAAAPDDAGVEILDGFPERIHGRLLLLPRDNLNTDGIYGKDYTYREGMTREEMARVVMENYDPGFAALSLAGDVLAGGWNFGTGSSREQAVTALQAKGIAMVIAGSFSQTYLRNAFNNGFLCVECPELITRLKEEMRSKIAGGVRTIVVESADGGGESAGGEAGGGGEGGPGGARGPAIAVDFRTGTIGWRGDEYRFPLLGTVPQSLVVEGGIEKLVRKRLGIE
ncbi:MAG: homoaconitase [Planctomycetota bacterium]